jgi:hypothetical protein
MQHSLRELIQLESARNPFGAEARHLLGVTADLKACFVKLSCDLGSEAGVFCNYVYSVFDKSRISEEEKTKISGFSLVCSPDTNWWVLPVSEVVMDPDSGEERERERSQGGSRGCEDLGNTQPSSRHILGVC